MGTRRGHEASVTSLRWRVDLKGEQMGEEGLGLWASARQRWGTDVRGGWVAAGHRWERRRGWRQGREGREIERRGGWRCPVWPRCPFLSLSPSPAGPAGVWDRPAWVVSSKLRCLEIGAGGCAFPRIAEKFEVKVLQCN